MKPKTKKQKQMDADNVTATANELDKAAEKLIGEVNDLKDCSLSTINMLETASGRYRWAKRRSNEKYTFTGGDKNPHAWRVATEIHEYDVK
jgi:hypothetical protein